MFRIPEATVPYTPYMALFFFLVSLYFAFDRWGDTTAFQWALMSMGYAVLGTVVAFGGVKPIRADAELGDRFPHLVRHLRGFTLVGLVLIVLLAVLALGPASG